MLIIGTRNTYNDGKWHKLDAIRVMASCSLAVDDEIQRVSSASPYTEITAGDTINFGGNNKGIVHVKNVGFDGCMRKISIDGTEINLNENVEAVELGNKCQVSDSLIIMLLIFSLIAIRTYLQKILYHPKRIN